MRALVTGAAGLVGSARLEKIAHPVWRPDFELVMDPILDLDPEKGFEGTQRRVADTTSVSGEIGFEPRATLGDIIEQVIADQQG